MFSRILSLLPVFMPNHLDNMSVNQFVGKNSIKAIILINCITDSALAGKSNFHFVMNTRNYSTLMSPHIYFKPEERNIFRTRFELATTVKPVEAVDSKNSICSCYRALNYGGMSYFMEVRFCTLS
jgi:hypothetical protein